MTDAWLRSSVLSLAAVLCACGGGSGAPLAAPPAFGSFLQLLPPGTVDDRSNVSLRPGAHLVDDSERLVSVGDRYVLLAPTHAYAVGDVIAGGHPVPFLRRVTAVDAVNGSVVLETEPANMADLIEVGSLRFAVSPGWSSLTQTGSTTSQLQGAEEALRVDDDGTIHIDDYTLVRLEFGDDGAVDWSSSTLMNQPINPFDPAEHPDVDDNDSLAPAAEGSISAVLDGQIRVRPTCDVDARFDIAGLAYARVQQDILLEVSSTITVEASAAVSVEFERSLWSLEIPVAIGPVVTTIDVSIPISFSLKASIDGTATFEYGAAFALQAVLEYDRARSPTVTLTKRYSAEQRAADATVDVQGHVDAELFMGANVSVKLYDAIGPYLNIGPYVHANLLLPVEADVDELTVGLRGEVGLELSIPVWDKVFLDRSFPLFDVELWGVDLWGPRTTDPENRAPVAEGLAALASPGGSVLVLPAHDPDSDSLLWRVVTSPQHGRVTWRNQAGLVMYVPDPGYEGPDAFSYDVFDGELRSNVAVVEVEVVPYPPPRAWFFGSIRGNEAVVDATPSSGEGELLVRWDWEDDGSYDTEWMSERTASHLYPGAPSRSIRLEVEDAAGLRDSTALSLGLQAAWVQQAGSPASDLPAGVAILADGSCLSCWFGHADLLYGNVAGLVGPTGTGKGVLLSRSTARGDVMWIRRVATGDLHVTGLAAFADGSCAITGDFASTATFGPEDPSPVDMTAQGGYDAFVLRCDAQGKLLWVRAAGGVREDAGTSVAALESGECVIGGRFNDLLRLDGTHVLDAPGQHGFVARYSDDGDLAWAVTVADWVSAVAASPSGLVLASGAAGGIIDVAGTDERTFQIGAPGLHVFVVCYDSTGSIVWARHDGGMEGTALAPLRDGSVVVVGTNWTGGLFGEGEPTQTAVSESGFVARYGAFGSLQWVRGVAGDSVTPLATASWSDGSIVVAGRVRGSAIFEGKAAEIALPGVGGPFDMFVVRYDPDGEVVAATGGVGGGYDQGNALALSPDGSFVVMGQWEDHGTLNVWGLGAVELDSVGTGDIVIARYGLPERVEDDAGGADDDDDGDGGTSGDDSGGSGGGGTPQSLTISATANDLVATDYSDPISLDATISWPAHDGEDRYGHVALIGYSSTWGWINAYSYYSYPGLKLAKEGGSTTITLTSKGGLSCPLSFYCDSKVKVAFAWQSASGANKYGSVSSEEFALSH